MADALIAGVGLTPFGAHPGRAGRDLFAEAVDEAITDAGIHRSQVEELFYGNYISEIAEQQGHQGALMADAGGIDGPAVRFESACASSGVAMRHAVSQIRTGRADVLLVGGMERMTHLETEVTTDALATAADNLWETRFGMTFPGAYGLMANAYFDQYGGSREDLAHIAVKNHEHATGNEIAQFQREITVRDVLDAPVVSSPLGLYDACPITDGASAVVLVSESFAHEQGLDASVAVTGTGQGNDTVALQDRASLTQTPATAEAATRAYRDAGISAADIDCVEVHDCFTIAEVLAIEALGFYEHGDGIVAARRGETTRDGKRPVNLSGGLKAKGHPVGATGTAQIAELTKLLRGDHVNSDAIPHATTGLAQNAGGTVASATVHVLEVVA